MIPVINITLVKINKRYINRRFCLDEEKISRRLYFQV